MIPDYAGPRAVLPLHFSLAVDRDGGKHRSAKVVADNVYFGNSKRGESADVAPDDSVPADNGENSPP